MTTTAANNSTGTVKVFTKDLIDEGLDWAVATGEGKSPFIDKAYYGKVCRYGTFVEPGRSFRPSTDWAHGGPIIDREIIEKGLLISARLGKCEAVYPGKPEWDTHYGPTPLIAAMRCAVASKMGNEIEIPTALYEAMLRSKTEDADEPQAESAPVPGG
jgi:Protein of unknown function (DUF2591)